MSKISVVFCGSFQEYSAIVLQGLLNTDEVEVVGVVTTPPFVTKKQETIKNPVQELAEFKGRSVFTPAVLDETSLTEIENAVGVADLLVTAGYGKLLPETWLSWPSVAALNLHFSVLPKYRGANPAEWAILCGETETGVTLIEMSPKFDTGNIIATATSPITDSDTRETVYQALYSLGGEVISEMIAAYMKFRHENSVTQNTDRITYHLPPKSQAESPTPYAARFVRDDSFIDWKAIETAINGKSADPKLVSEKVQEILTYTHQSLDATFIERAIRALAGFPGVWTKIPTAKGDKRMKLLTAQIKGSKLALEEVQIEGKPITRWVESKNILT